MDGFVPRIKSIKHSFLHQMCPLLLMIQKKKFENCADCFLKTCFVGIVVVAMMMIMMTVVTRRDGHREQHDKLFSFDDVPTCYIQLPPTQTQEKFMIRKENGTGLQMKAEKSFSGKNVIRTYIQWGSM